MREFRGQAMDAGNVVLFSGRKVLAEGTAGRDRSYLLEQAVDFDHWSRVGSGELEVAPEVARIPRPRLGYFGAIESWLVDGGLINRPSRERPHWNRYFIGNKSPRLQTHNLPTPLSP